MSQSQGARLPASRFYPPHAAKAMQSRMMFPDRLSVADVKIRFGAGTQPPQLARSYRTAFDRILAHSCRVVVLVDRSVSALSGLSPFASPRPSNGEKFTNASERGSQFESPLLHQPFVRNSGRT